MEIRKKEEEPSLDSSLLSACSWCLRKLPSASAHAAGVRAAGAAHTCAFLGAICMCALHVCMWQHLSAQAHPAACGFGSSACPACRCSFVTHVHAHTRTLSCWLTQPALAECLLGHEALGPSRVRPKVGLSSSLVILQACRSLNAFQAFFEQTWSILLGTGPAGIPFSCTHGSASVCCVTYMCCIFALAHCACCMLFFPCSCRLVSNCPVWLLLSVGFLLDTGLHPLSSSF